MTLDTVRQPALNGFDLCNVQADIANEAQREQKPVVGWGDNGLLGDDPTANAASIFHKTGVIWMKGAALEGHYNKRRGEIERMIVLSIDEARQQTRLDEWIIGRICRDCRQRKTLDSHHFHRNPDGRHGFKSFCKSCCNRN